MTRTAARPRAPRRSRHTSPDVLGDRMAIGCAHCGSTEVRLGPPVARYADEVDDRDAVPAGCESWVELPCDCGDCGDTTAVLIAGRRHGATIEPLRRRRGR